MRSAAVRKKRRPLPIDKYWSDSSLNIMLCQDMKELTVHTVFTTSSLNELKLY
ncbi:MAG: hypothetical protein ABI614_22790 [Planctomycetota bacterium]